MSTIRQRLGNVTAWIGFAALIFGALPLAVLTGGSIWEAEIQEQPRIIVGKCDWVTPLVVEDLFPDENSDPPSKSSAEMTVSEDGHEIHELVGRFVEIGFEPEKCGLDYEPNPLDPFERAGQRVITPDDAFAFVMWNDQPYFFYGKYEVLETKYFNPHHNVKRWLADREVGYSYRTWRRPYNDVFEETAALSSLWVLCLVLNYIFYGSTRILPWKRLRGDG
jgi:hypothetical protein